MNRQNTIGKHKTQIRNENGITYVRYHQTDVVAFNDDIIVLNDGGWKTVTTKLRMNQTANQFNLGFGVSQRKGEWFVMLKNPKYTTEGVEAYWLAEELPFKNEIRLCRTHFGRRVVPFVAITAKL